ncbi:Cro/Cl family transcriptional regulator [Undibacterium sp. Ji83W]|uniref:Cro/Cl family transcriptional regulator n=1 Tax=Undibacterium sp. Ji83W TaxID=3413043 RepID=UPI003BEFD107
MRSVKFLEKLQYEKRMNDTEVAAYLKISKSAVSQYKSGNRIMDDETCLGIALGLGINPMEIVGAACIDRAEKTGQKSLWEVFMSRMAATASALLLCFSVNLLLTLEKAEAAPVLAYSHVVDGENFILC